MKGNIDRDIETSNEDEKKQCKYDRKGYCRESENCAFLHSESVCDLYLQTGICWRQTCRVRHPKVCRYGDKCYRGSDCRYLHLTSPCGKCQTFSRNCYHCEFCMKSFCQNCTVEKAQAKNIYDEEMVIFIFFIKIIYFKC